MHERRQKEPHTVSEHGSETEGGSAPSSPSLMKPHNVFLKTPHSESEPQQLSGTGGASGVAEAKSGAKRSSSPVWTECVPFPA